jgi:hypothetical protein
MEIQVELILNDLDKDVLKAGGKLAAANCHSQAV